LNQRAVDAYTDILDRESMSLIKALFVESKEGAVPVNPQVCVNLEAMLSVIFISLFKTNGFILGYSLMLDVAPSIT
jgi:hypothetical protein